MTESFVYIVECSDKTLYTGWTNKPLERIQAHSTGKGAKYTKGRGPVTLVYLEALEDRSTGLIREAQIKKLATLKKRELIQEHFQRTKDLEQELKDIQNEKKQK